MKSLSLTKPHMIIMVGLPGSGKSFFAEKFADTFHAPYVNRQKIEKLTSENVEALAQLQAAELLKTNQSFIFEGASDTHTERTILAKMARDAGYEPLFLWVQVDALTARDRSVTSKHVSLPLEVFERISKRFTPPNNTEKPLVISGKHTYASQAKVVLKKLSSPRAEISNHPIAPERTPQPGRRSITIR
jgi:predicted kinase